MTYPIEDIAKEIRKDIIKMHQKGPHVGSALSVVDILAVLYFDIMNIPSPLDPNRDRFILSKGHAVSALYATLAEKGFINKKLLEEYLANNSILYGHPVKDEVCGIEVSTGSLGHGLPMGLGMALAAKHDKKKFKIYIVMGDGECQEGSVWEAAMLASRLKLDNMFVIVDANNLQGYDIVENIQPVGSLKGKWEAFGWKTEDVNGNNVSELKSVLRYISSNSDGKPHVVIAHTIKGKGIKEMENKLEWHYLSVPNDKVGSFIKELDK